MTHIAQSSAGFGFSKEFVEQLSEKELRDAFMADQVRVRIALLIRALREQKDRQWSQSELGRRAGKPQNVISRLEDPDYGRLTVETLLEVAAAIDLPLLIDMPEWDDWLLRTSDLSPQSLERHSFELERLTKIAEAQTHRASQAAAAFEKLLKEQQKPSGFFEKLSEERQRQSGFFAANDDSPPLGSALRAAAR
jgi:transcriptional regulator with XRE-family HTH domain